MAAGVSGSLAEVRTAKALLLLVDDMAFDTIGVWEQADVLNRESVLNRAATTPNACSREPRVFLTSWCGSGP